MTAAELAALGVTPETILHVYSWGFGAVLAAWLIGYGVNLSVSLLRKL